MSELVERARGLGNSDLGVRYLTDVELNLYRALLRALCDENERMYSLLDGFDRYASSPPDNPYPGSPFQFEVRSALRRVL